MDTSLVELHERVVVWGQRKARADEEEGRLLLEVQRSRVHEHLGMGFADYAERFLGNTAKWTLERLRVAKALEDLPETRVALRDGEINWSAARELTRVAVRHTEDLWLLAAKRKSVRQVEDMVSGHRPGDRPDDPVDEKLKRYFLHVELSAESMATVREAVAKLKKDGLDDDAAYLTMARSVLGGPEDTGKSSYQIALVVCPACDQGYQQGDGELVPVAQEIVEMACCDSNHISGKRARQRQSVTPAVRKKVFARDHGRCRVPGCPNRRWVDVHHIVWQSFGGNHDLDNLILMCAAHHNRLHRGQIKIEQLAPRGKLEFRHSDGSPYGSPRSISAAITAAEAFQASQ